MRELLIAHEATGPLGPVVNFMDTLVRCACAGILWISFLFMLLPTFANAVLRYTTNASLVWSVEIVQLTFPWFIMAGAVLAAQHSRHIGVMAFVSLLPNWLRLSIALLVQGLVLTACLAVMYVHIGFGLYDGGMTFAAGSVIYTSLGVSQWWSYLALLVGYALLALTTVGVAYRIGCSISLRQRMAADTGSDQ